ncbi:MULTISPECIES: ABC transporter ATP-binding protein [Actinoalloteichus]|uniref:ABC-type antimicrobial peptide transport system, ATPase component n=1 Tax=Actinoalloteichus fjordicus TaxID=1612552 RepID=A0AAC9L9R6_9PSEU|nr:MULTISPECIES: ABC transporter ATP-binding protein [Actinoalloteichus]APU12930.1 ABC-type antimicrobial peptide transport system, ATPase component [Actinoalloteichus fjordicus]APU18902.1 ABC-type antimicrobial peptide transport system, ATPase component [Actinoalloteichus sp. GBA129-24]
MNSPSRSDAVLRTISAGRVYGKGGARVVALDAVSLDFPRGSFTAVMGASGSGKSTLLHCASGLDTLTEGSVLLDGVDLATLSEERLTLLRRERVGFVFQQFNLLPALTAAQNVALPRRLAGHRPRRAEIMAVLDRVGLADRAAHRPTELSGGQQQRVALARALATRPEVLFADEPTGALDRAAGRVVLGLLRELVDVAGQTVVMVTHDPLAASYADGVVFLADGRVAAELRGADASGIAEQLTRLETAAEGAKQAGSPAGSEPTWREGSR